MAIEFHLQRTDKTPWGFRLTGGVEYDVPLTVIKVAQGSIAENVGMEVGDHVVRVNDIPMASLTHPQAHDVLQSAGNDFIIAVRRGDLSNLPPKLLFYETSVENSEEAIKNEVHRMEEDNNLNITDEEIVNIIGEQVHIATQRATEMSSTAKSVQNIESIQSVQNIESIQSVQISEEVTEEISEQIEISATQKQQSEVTKMLEESSKEEQERKWSTFLQKPKNPKPKPKLSEPEGPKASPYKVIIKKQPKKGQEPPKEDSAITEEKTESNILENGENKETVEENEEIRTEQNESYQDKNELDENISQDQGQEVEDKEEKENPPDSEPEIRDEEREIENIQEEPDTNLFDRKLSINLEEQLAQVQQQLLALSQLPSAIQQTLNAVTQQLAEIVSVKQTQEQEIEASATIEEEITEEFLEISENEERPLSVLEEETSEHYEEEHKDEEENIKETTERNESEDEQALFEMLEKEIEEEERRKQEELETHEKNEKRDKERRSSHPQTPLQRPIILPGGRKWSQPDDAVSKIRRPSMTDEKIANTINTFTEVIVGRTMGINFLKYQPPPKNLEHLQKSAVYRLVHDMEPPVKGIVTRDGKILAEQDYYTEKQEEKDLPAQMSR